MRLSSKRRNSIFHTGMGREKPRFEMASTATREATRVPNETMFPSSPNRHWTKSSSAD